MSIPGLADVDTRKRPRSDPHADTTLFLFALEPGTLFKDDAQTFLNIARICTYAFHAQSVVAITIRQSQQPQFHITLKEIETSQEEIPYAQIIIDGIPFRAVIATSQFQFKNALPQRLSLKKSTIRLILQSPTKLTLDMRQPTRSWLDTWTTEAAILKVTEKEILITLKSDNTEVDTIVSDSCAGIVLASMRFAVRGEQDASFSTTVEC